MARFATFVDGIVENGIVANIVEAENEQACSHLAPVVPVADDVARGWLYDGEAFSKPPTSPIVPDSVSPRAAKLALYATPWEGEGDYETLLDAVEAFLATRSRAIQISWSSSLEFKRHDPGLLAVAAALGMNDAQIDALFLLAQSYMA